MGWFRCYIFFPDKLPLHTTVHRPRRTRSSIPPPSYRAGKAVPSRGRIPEKDTVACVPLQPGPAGGSVDAKETW